MKIKMPPEEVDPTSMFQARQGCSNLLAICGYSPGHLPSSHGRCEESLGAELQSCPRRAKTERRREGRLERCTGSKSGRSHEAPARSP